MKTVQLYSRMDWFDVGEQPDQFSDLPPCFAAAYDLWTSDSDGNLENIIALLESYLTASFYPARIQGPPDIVFSPSEDYPVKITASHIKLLGVDFSVNPIPLATAEALFDIPLHAAFENANDLARCQRQRIFLESGVVFGWNVPLLNQDHEFDLMCGCHEGLQCVLPEDTEEEN